jgi:hypothetical protein
VLLQAAALLMLCSTLIRENFVAMQTIELFVFVEASQPPASGQEKPVRMENCIEASEVFIES